MYTLLFEGSDHPLDHAALLRVMRGDELLAQPIVESLADRLDHFSSSPDRDCNFFLARNSGNPPENPECREVDFLPEEGFYGDEEVSVHGQSDHGRAQARGVRDLGA